MRLAALAFIALTLPATAQRAGDEVFTETGLADALSGQVMEFFDDSTATYRADGSYAYRYTADGDDWTGRWSTNDASQVCVDFDNGSSRCDTIVRDGERFVMIIDTGERFPARDLTPVEADS